MDYFGTYIPHVILQIIYDYFHKIEKLRFKNHPIFSKMKEPVIKRNKLLANDLVVHAARIGCIETLKFFRRGNEEWIDQEAGQAACKAKSLECLKYLVSSGLNPQWMVSFKAATYDRSLVLLKYLHEELKGENCKWSEHNLHCNKGVLHDNVIVYIKEHCMEEKIYHPILFPERRHDYDLTIRLGPIDTHLNT